MVAYPMTANAPRPPSTLPKHKRECANILDISFKLQTPTNFGGFCQVSVKIRPNVNQMLNELLSNFAQGLTIRLHFDTSHLRYTMLYVLKCTFSQNMSILQFAFFSLDFLGNLIQQLAGGARPTHYSMGESLEEGTASIQWNKSHVARGGGVDIPHAGMSASALFHLNIFRSSRFSAIFVKFQPNFARIYK